jgi:hypothetical protein
MFVAMENGMVPRAVSVLGMVAAMALGGCAAPDPWPALERDGGCLAAFATVDRAVAAAGVGDAQAARVAGFPYLRANRFLASFDGATLDGEAFAAWVDRLRALDAAAREAEVANLPAGFRVTLAELGRCAATMRAADFAQPAGRAALARAVHAPDSYQDWKRALGLYPVTALAVAIGFERWKDRNLDGFAAPPAATGSLLRYGPDGTTLAPDEVAAILKLARANPLDIPDPNEADRVRLLAAFAPLWSVDTLTEADRIGAPRWRGGRVVVVGPSVVYTRFSHTRFDGEILLQISYMAWFPERPRQGAVDLLSGALDAVIWRVTLGRDGRPLIYDTIHGCGCYHLFFPSARLTPRRQFAPDDISERALVPAAAPELAPGKRIVVSLAAASHYVRHVSVVGPGAGPGADNTVPYALAPADDLRSLPAGAGRRSIYGPDGLVAGSERLERFVLWPMGIASPGAMRQWGHHATAFVGRRHFDDADLFDAAFAPAR